jgi:hypothetical protein
MPRQARLDAPGTLHHVMIHGIERANIFRDDKDREHFISRVVKGELGSGLLIDFEAPAKCSIVE